MKIESCGVMPDVTRDPEDAKLKLEECGAVVFEPIDCTEEALAHLLKHFLANAFAPCLLALGYLKAVSTTSREFKQPIR